jgi:NADH-quinone oxidoreductase subunit G
MIKQDGKWLEVDWQTALEYVANGLRRVARRAWCEDRLPGGAVFDHGRAVPRRPADERAGWRQYRSPAAPSDFSLDGKLSGAPWLGMKIAEVSQLDAVLVVGSFLRKDHPCSRNACVRPRAAASASAHSASMASDWLMTLHARVTGPVGELSQRAGVELVQRCSADSRCRRACRHCPAPCPRRELRIAQSLCDEGSNGHSSRFCGAATCPMRRGLHGRSAGTVVHHGCHARVPGRGGQQRRCRRWSGAQAGLNARDMLTAGLRCLRACSTRNLKSIRRIRRRARALNAADTVIVMSPFKSGTRVRGLPAAGVALHRNLRHLRQLRRPHPEFSCGCPSARRKPSCLEGASRPRQHARSRPDSISIRPKRCATRHFPAQASWLPDSALGNVARDCSAGVG